MIAEAVGLLRVAVMVFAALVSVCYIGPARARDNNEAQISSRLHYLGEQLHDQLNSAGRLYRDEALEAYLDSVLNRVARHQAAQGVYVIIDSDPNAFISPHGHIYLQLGLLLRIQDEAELALVLAHEAAHVELQHPLAHLNSQPSSVRILASRVPLFGKVLYTDRRVGFGRSLEFAADEKALEDLSEAGYDIGAALRLYRRLAAEEAPGTSTARHNRATHPLVSERLARFRELMLPAEFSGSADQRATSYLSATRKARIDGLDQLLELREANTLITLIERTPTHFGPHSGYFLAAAHRIAGDVSDRAVRAALNQTLTRLPDYGPAHRLLGQLQMDALDLQGAAAAFATYLELSPGAPDAAAVKAQLTALEAM